MKTGPTPSIPEQYAYDEQPVVDFFAHPSEEGTAGAAADTAARDDGGAEAKKISDDLATTKKLIEEKNREGFDTTGIRDLYRQCGNVFASGDILTASHYLERIHEELDGLSSTGIVDSEAAIPSGDATAFGLKSARTVEVKGDKVPGDSESRSDKWEIDAKPKLDDKEKAIHALESAKNSIIEADENGYDSESAKIIFRSARPLYESGNFKGVLDKIREVEREILRIKGHNEHEIEEILGEETDIDFSSDADMTPEERRILNDMISKVWVMLKEADRYKLETTKYKDRLDYAKSRRTFREAKKIVDLANKEIKKYLSDYESEQHNISSNKFHHVRSEILRAQKLGIDLKPYNDMLDIASSAISRSNYEYALLTMENCLKELAAAKEAQTTSASSVANGSVTKLKSEPEWESDDGEYEKSVGSGQPSLSEEKLLENLENRLILGEISEDTYRELKEKIIKRKKP